MRRLAPAEEPLVADGGLRAEYHQTNEQKDRRDLGGRLLDVLEAMEDQT